MAGEIKYVLPVHAQGKINPRWIMLVVFMGQELVSELAGHLHA